MGNYLSRSMGPPLSLPLQLSYLYLSRLHAAFYFIFSCFWCVFFSLYLLPHCSNPPPPRRPTLPLASHRRLRSSRLDSYRLLTRDSSAAPRPLAGVAFPGAEYVTRVAGLTSTPSKYNDSCMFAQAESTPPPPPPPPPRQQQPVTRITY